MSDHAGLRGGSGLVTRRTALLLALGSLPLVAAAGCASPSAPTAGPTGTATQSGTPAPTSTTGPTGATASTPAATEFLALVRSVSAGPPANVELSPVEMLIGDEAIAQAKKDGSDVVEQDENGNDFIPNDYYLRPLDPTQRRYPLAPTCEIKVVAPEEDTVEPIRTVSPEGLAALVATYQPLMEVRLDAVGAEVISLTEVYLP